MFGVRLVVSALSVSLIITEKQKYDMIFQSLFLISTIITYVISLLLKLGIKDFIVMISILFSATYLIYGFVGYYYSRKKNINN